MICVWSEIRISCTLSSDVVFGASKCALSAVAMISKAAARRKLKTEIIHTNRRPDCNTQSSHRFKDLFHLLRSIQLGGALWKAAGVSLWHINRNMYLLCDWYTCRWHSAHTDPPDLSISCLIPQHERISILRFFASQSNLSDRLCIACHFDS